MPTAQVPPTVPWDALWRAVSTAPEGLPSASCRLLGTPNPESLALLLLGAPHFRRRAIPSHHRRKDNHPRSSTSYAAPRLRAIRGRLPHGVRSHLSGIIVAHTGQRALIQVFIWRQNLLERNPSCFRQPHDRSEPSLGIWAKEDSSSGTLPRGRPGARCTLP